MVTNPASASVSVLHQINVGETLIENIDGHAARSDSPEFVDARATVQKIVATLNPNPYGPPPIQAHHGGSLWLYDGKRWRVVLNWAGIEWSAQFCCDPARVEALRQDAEVMTAAFPETIPELEKLGYKGKDLLSTPVTDAAGVAKYVDSIWNSCVPIPQLGHTGSVTATTALGAGVHNYPEPMCAIPRVMQADFIPIWLTRPIEALDDEKPVEVLARGDYRRIAKLIGELEYPGVS